MTDWRENNTWDMSHNFKFLYFCLEEVCLQFNQYYKLVFKYFENNAPNKKLNLQYWELGFILFVELILKLWPVKIGFFVLIKMVKGGRPIWTYALYIPQH